MKSVPHQSGLSLDHIVFYRAWMEGTLELKDIARRYLGEHEVEEADKTLMRIEKALIVACKHSGCFSYARLIRLNMARLRKLSLVEQQPTDQPTNCSGQQKLYAILSSFSV